MDFATQSFRKTGPTLCRGLGGEADEQWSLETSQPALGRHRGSLGSPPPPVAEIFLDPRGPPSPAPKARADSACCPWPLPGGLFPLPMLSPRPRGKCVPEVRHRPGTPSISGCSLGRRVLKATGSQPRPGAPLPQPRCYLQSQPPASPGPPGTIGEVVAGGRAPALWSARLRNCPGVCYGLRPKLGSGAGAVKAGGESSRPRSWGSQGETRWARSTPKPEVRPLPGVGAFPGQGSGLPAAAGTTTKASGCPCE